jgi:hypothetical protein
MLYLISDHNNAIYSVPVGGFHSAPNEEEKSICAKQKKLKKKIEKQCFIIKSLLRQLT